MQLYERAMGSVVIMSETLTEIMSFALNQL